MWGILKNNKFLSLASNGITAVLGLVRFGLIARVLPQEDLGIWTFFFMLFVLFEMVRTGLLSSVIVNKWGSADTDNRKSELTGAAWQLANRATLWMVGLSIVLYFGLQAWGGNRAYLLSALYFAPSMLLSLPQTVATWLLTARMRFDSLLGLRLAFQIPNFLGAVLLFWGAPYLTFFGISGLTEVFWIHLVSTIVVSAICVLMGWSGIRHWRKGNTKTRKELLDFGIYSMGTLISTNLLKSSDTFLLMALRGPIAVAVYNIPERLLGILEIPVRSIVSATYPKLAYVQSHEPKKFNRLLHGETFLLTTSMLPVVVAVIVFADYFVVWLGGEKYADSANVLRVFAVYTAFVPMDRYLGIAMDALGKPEMNFKKVVVMLVVNLVGDLLVLWMGFGVLAVSVVSVFTFGTGVFYGYYLLGKSTSIRAIDMLRIGLQELSGYRKIFIDKINLRIFPKNRKNT